MRQTDRTDRTRQTHGDRQVDVLTDAKDGRTDEQTHGDRQTDRQTD